MGKVSSLATTDLFKNMESEKTIVLSEKQLRKLQLVILGIASDVIEVCENNDIVYHLTGGSALGAVRHNGFIPWDDDMDIDISSADYDRFLKKFVEKYGDKYYIHNWNSSNIHCLPSTQIRLKNTKIVGVNDYSTDEAGIYLDIISMENTFNSKIFRYIHGSISLLLGFIVSCRKFWYKKEFFLNMTDDKNIKKVFKKKAIIGFIFSFLTLRRWTKIYVWWNGICHNNNSKYVVVPTGRKHFFGELYERADFYNTRYHAFEKYNWKIPYNYDKYLTKMYGDYMKIPPESKREKHVVLELDFGKDM